MAGSASDEATYSATARRFHWWTAAFVLLLQIPVGLFMVRYGAATDFAAPTGQLYDGHKLMGLLILSLVLARLAYRLARGAPPDEPTIETWQKALSHLTHWGLYLMLIVVAFLGWLATSYYGEIRPFGIKVPSLVAADTDYSTTVYNWHKLAAYVLIVLIGMHIGGALYHYFIRKDGVLRRMLPSAGKRT
jgi:cytochrome b561